MSAGRAFARLKPPFTAFVLLLSAVSIRLAGAPATNLLVPPQDAFALRRIELLPPPATVPLVPVRFPVAWPVARVVDIGTTPGRVWIDARGWRQTNGTGGKIWVFAPSANRLDPLRGRLEPYDAVDLEVRRDGVWIGLDGGVAAVDPATMVLDTYAAPQGLTTTDVLGLATAGSRLMAISRAGVLYGLNANSRSWSRAGDTSAHNLRRLAPWQLFAGSGEWMLLVGPEQILGRHQAAAEFEEMRAKQWGALPSVDPPRWTSIAGDGDGGFWIGSDLGLHFVLPETGSMEHRIAPRGPTVPGGLRSATPSGFRPAPAAYDMARTRVAEEIRDRMRARARLAKLATELGTRLDPVTPTTRLPGGVRALKADGPFLWVASQVGTNTGRTDLLLLHMASRKWVARVAVPAVVTSIAVDEENVWMGCDLTRGVVSPPVLAVSRKPLMNTPPARWVPDEIPALELGNRLASLSVHERAVMAFFAGDAAKVTELLDGHYDDAESLFLLAFANEVPGNAPDPRRAERLQALHEKYPASTYAEATRSLVPKTVPAEAVVPAVVEPKPDAEVPPLERLFKRRDLDGNGKIDEMELRDWRGPDADMKDFDKNGDGVLDLAEFEAVLKAGGRGQ